MSMAKVLGCASETPTKRRAADWYATPPDATIAFLSAEGERLTALGRVWEPCAGDGAMSAVIAAYGLPVAVSDIAERGLNLIPEHRRSVFDFDTPLAPAIVTNPPFGSNAPRRLVEHALRIGVGYVALLLPSGFFNADDRAKLENRWKVARVYPLTWRPDWTGSKRPTQTMTWFVWDAAATEQTFRPLRRPAVELKAKQATAPLVDLMLSSGNESHNSGRAQ